MKFNDSLEFLQVKNDRGESLVVALQLEIETKIFDRFRRPFVTDKYITIVQWEEIMRNIEKRIGKEIKNTSFDSTKNKKEETREEIMVDDSLCIESRILPKQQSYINFKKLKADYILDWIMAVKITRKSHPVEASCGLSSIATVTQSDGAEYEPKSNIFNTATEYDPNSNSNGFAAISSYTASRKVSTENRTSPEYSPSPASLSISPVKYTPKKIKQNVFTVETDVDKASFQKKMKTSSLQEDLFGKDSSDELQVEKHEVNEKTDEKKGKKRRLLNLPEAVEKEIPTEKKTRKRVQHKASSSDSGFHQTRSAKKPEQKSMDCWISTVKKEKRIHVSTPIVNDPPRSKLKKSSKPAKSVKKRTNVVLDNPMAGITEEQLNKMNQFIDKRKQIEEEENKRRKELEDLVMISCNYLTEEQLETLVQNFNPSIKNFFEQASLNQEQQKDYNHMLISTSGVLTENQLTFVLQKIENQREVEDRGCYETMLMETILPEFIIYVIQYEFNLTKEEALEQLSKQDERQILFMKDDSTL